ncbi:MAG: hypothetical protein PHF87_07305, partial [Desulfotomaculaceae bacterium]|nr:hypothetical protein [Desulfotomaculaceae bacterium]
MKPILGILQKKILDTIPAGISIASGASGTEVIHNARAAEFLRIQPWEDFAFKSGENQSVKLYHNGKELTPAGLPLNRSAWKGETVKGIEIDFIWDDGVRKTAVWNANPLFDENGLIIGAVAIFEEITALKQAEEALQV